MATRFPRNDNRADYYQDTLNSYNAYRRNARRDKIVLVLQFILMYMFLSVLLEYYLRVEVTYGSWINLIIAIPFMLCLSVLVMYDAYKFDMEWMELMRKNLLGQKLDKI